MSIMVDLEGTLSDSSNRLAVLQRDLALSRDQRDRDAWRRYYKGLLDDPPTDLILKVRQWMRTNYVIVYSTRFVNKYQQEEEWLKRHELWDHVDLLQREATDTVIKGPQLVARWVMENRPNLLIDDRAEVRDCCRGLVPGLIVATHEDAEL